MKEILEIGGAALGALYVIACAWGLVAYILNAVSQQTLAKRRGIRGSWLAWVPFGNVWLLGRLADHYQQFKAGRKTKRAASLLTLTLLTVVFAVLSGSCLGFSGAYLAGHRPEAGSVAVMVLGILLLIAAIVLAIVLKITGLVACHSVFRSSKPASAAAFVVLCVFFPFLKPFFLMSCRKHDAGFLR